TAVRLGCPTELLATRRDECEAAVEGAIRHGDGAQRSAHDRRLRAHEDRRNSGRVASHRTRRAQQSDGERPPLRCHAQDVLPTGRTARLARPALAVAAAWSSSARARSNRRATAGGSDALAHGSGRMPGPGSTHALEPRDRIRMAAVRRAAVLHAWVAAVALGI